MTEFSAYADETKAGLRLDKFLSETFKDMSRARLQALIRDGQVTVKAGGAVRTIASPSYSVKLGDQFVVALPDAIEADPQPENIPLDVVFEDDHLIVVNKPAGMVVHPAPGSPTGTLVNALLHHCGDSLSGIGGVKRPGIVHRIDKDTSGLLVMAKHDKAHNGLAVQFADHSIERLYHAVCKGHPSPAADKIIGNIGRNPSDRKKMAVVKSGGKSAATHYRTLARFQQAGHALAAHIECKLETGRTHQVRVHMLSRGHPLIGDPVYARGSLPNVVKGSARSSIQAFKRQALHAKTLGFDHPVTGEAFKFECDLPYDFEELLNGLGAYKI